MGLAAFFGGGHQYFYTRIAAHNTNAIKFICPSVYHLWKQHLRLFTSRNQLFEHVPLFQISHLTRVDPSFNAALVDLFSSPYTGKQNQPHNAGILSKNNTFASNLEFPAQGQPFHLNLDLGRRKKVHEPARPVHSEGDCTLRLLEQHPVGGGSACSSLFHFSLFVFAADRISLTLSAITSWLAGQVKPPLHAMRAPLASLIIIIVAIW